MELTGAIKRGSQHQYLDKLQVERERGITVKARSQRQHHFSEAPARCLHSFNSSRSILRSSPCSNPCMHAVACKPVRSHDRCKQLLKHAVSQIECDPLKFAYRHPLAPRRPRQCLWCTATRGPTTC